MEQVYEMAVDALGLAITSRKKEGQEIPAPLFHQHAFLADNGVFVIVDLT